MAAAATAGVLYTSPVYLYPMARLNDDRIQIKEDYKGRQLVLSKAEQRRQRGIIGHRRFLIIERIMKVKCHALSIIGRL